MRAMVSVYDKTNVVWLCVQLAKLDIEVVSSGGTARVLSEAGVSVITTEEVTGWPDILGHRVVTLHPKIHGGILADLADDQHLTEMKDHGIEPFGLLFGNLYPFNQDPSIELIDIGGPAMLRGAAKNHANITVVIDPADYQRVIDELHRSKEETGTPSISAGLRYELARKAFAHTAAYDAAIVQWFDSEKGLVLPPTLHLAASRSDLQLRYGENPHQDAGVYTNGDSWLDAATTHQGKDLSYLNVYDADAAWQLVHSLGDEPTAVVIKHANPCGVAIDADITEAYRRAHACDETSAFGGIVAIHRPMPRELAEALVQIFTEVVIAPGYEDGALEVLNQKPNVRVLEAPAPAKPGLHVRHLDGGRLILAQTPDQFLTTRDDWTVATEREPTEEEWRDLELAWRLVARTTSNAIVLVKDRQAVGIGCGQQNRRDAGRIAGEKAQGRAAGGACASDAFFPFRDGLEAAAEAGATAVIQPGGSVRDDEVIAAANEADMAMVLTGERHFKH